jgi:hypothetical protein
MIWLGEHTSAGGWLALAGCTGRVRAVGYLVSRHDAQADVPVIGESLAATLSRAGRRLSGGARVPEVEGQGAAYLFFPQSTHKMGEAVRLNDRR